MVLTLNYLRQQRRETVSEKPHDNEWLGKEMTVEIQLR